MLDFAHGYQKEIQEEGDEEKSCRRKTQAGEETGLETQTFQETGRAKEGCPKKIRCEDETSDEENEISDEEKDKQEHGARWQKAAAKE